MITPITIEIVHIQTLGTNIFQTTVLYFPHITETETIQTLGIGNTQIINHETFKTKDQTLIIITIDRMAIPRTENLITQIDKKKILSRQIGIRYNTKIHNKTIEVAHLNIKDKSTKYNQLKKPNQTLPVLLQRIQNFQLYHINCEFTDDESETENTLSINMVQIENEYETLIKSNYYQNNKSHFQNPDNIQEITEYTEQELKGSSSTNNINQNKANKVQILKEKVWTLILKSPKSKDFQSPDLEINFLKDSGAESFIVSLTRWNDKQSLHPKLTFLP